VGGEGRGRDWRGRGWLVVERDDGDTQSRRSHSDCPPRSAPSLHGNV